MQQFDFDYSQDLLDFFEIDIKTAERYCNKIDALFLEFANSTRESLNKAEVLERATKLASKPEHKAFLIYTVTSFAQHLHTINSTVVFLSNKGAQTPGQKSPDDLVVDPKRDGVAEMLGSSNSQTAHAELAFRAFVYKSVKEIQKNNESKFDLLTTFAHFTNSKDFKVLSDWSPINNWFLWAVVYSGVAMTLNDLREEFLEKQRSS